MADATTLRRFSRQELVLLSLTTLFYVVMMGHYRTFDVDSVWFLSFTHAYWREGVSTDQMMAQPFPAGMGGVVAFGKLAAILQGSLLSVVGWSLAAANMLCAAFVAASLWLLADMCRRLGYSAHLTMCFVALVGLTEPFVVAAQETRFEFVTLLLLSLALWMAARNWVLAAAFVATVSVEVQPIAPVFWLAVVVTLLVQQRGKAPLHRTLLKIGAGFVMGAAVYAVLHPDMLQLVRTVDWRSSSRRSFPGGFVVGYYGFSKRHLVDLAALLAAGFVALRFRSDLLRHWSAAAIGAIVAGSAALRWENPHYFSLAMPFIAMFVALAFYSERRWRWVVAGVLMVMLPQYAYRYWFSVRRSPAFTRADDREMSAAVGRVAAGMGVDPDKVLILGNVYAWFARPGNWLALDRHLLMPGIVERPDVVLCFETKLDAVLAPAANPELTCSELNGLRAPAETLVVHGRRLEVIAQAGEGVTAVPAWMFGGNRPAK